MPSGKFMFTLIGLMLAMLAIYNMNFKQDTIEGWWGAGSPSFTWKAMPAIQQKGCGGMTAAGGNFVGHLDDNRFIKTPQFQSMLSPRFSTENYGANIRYNMADYQNQAVPCTPQIGRAHV